MDAVEYVKELRRICKSHTACNVCPLNSKFCFIANNMCEDAEKAVKFVEQWAKDHPVKTRQSEFLKMFPKAETDKNGILIFCPRKFDPENRNSVHCHRHGCLECRTNYWLTEVTE